MQWRRIIRSASRSSASLWVPLWSLPRRSTLNTIFRSRNWWVIKYHGHQYHGANVDEVNRLVVQEVEKPPAEPTREEQLQSQLSQQLNLPSLQDSSAGVNLNVKQQPPEGKVMYSWFEVFTRNCKVVLTRFLGEIHRKFHSRRMSINFFFRVYNKIRKGWIPLSLIFQEIICAIISDDIWDIIKYKCTYINTLKYTHFLMNLHFNHQVDGKRY